MDTSADRTRTRGRLANAEQVLEQDRRGQRPTQQLMRSGNPPFQPREGFLRRRQPPDLREVVCYNCQKKGHLSRNCTQPRQPRTNVRSSEVVDDRSEAGEDLHIAQMVADDRTATQWKDDWLRMAANETDEFKDLAMQELMGGKDFGDA